MSVLKLSITPQVNHRKKRNPVSKDSALQPGEKASGFESDVGYEVTFYSPFLISSKSLFTSASFFWEASSSC